MKRISLALVLLGLSAPCLGQTNAYAGPDETGQPRFVIDQQYRTVLTSIRNAALKQREGDGGRLTPQHTADVQFKINEATRAYRNLLWKNDPQAVNKDGSLRR